MKEWITATLLKGATAMSKKFKRHTYQERVVPNKPLDCL
jgi:hypothetical protein